MNWETFTGYVDKYKGQLTPEEMQILNRTTNGGMVDQGTMSKNIRDATQMLQRKFGWDAKAASNFVMMNGSVLRKGGVSVDEFTGWGGDIGDRKSFTSDEEYQKAILQWMGLESEPNQPGAAGAEPGREDLMGKMQQFYDQLTKGIPDDDPTAQYIQRHAANIAQAYGGRSGLTARSSLGAGAAAAQTQNELRQYDFQRKQLGSQVLGLMNQRDIGLGQLQQNFANQQNSLAEQQAAFKQNQAQGIGAILGGVAGTAIGAYAGGPMGAAAGGTAGSQLGGGIGGLFGGMGSGAPQYRQPGGLGGRNPYTGW